MKRLLIIILILTCVKANAQISSVDSSQGCYWLDKGHFFLLDVRFGGVNSDSFDPKVGFGVNLGGEYRFNKYIALDYINIEYAGPFNFSKYYGVVSAKTGLRGFSPSFMADQLRIYTNISVGYSCVFDKYYNRKMHYYHGFGLTFGAGIQIKKKYSVGYTLQIEKGRETKCHFANIGFAF